MPTSKSKWSDLLFFKGCGFLVAAAVGCLLVASGLGILVPRQVTELARAYGNEHEYIRALWLLGAVFVGTYINRVTYQLLVNVYIRRLVQHVRMSCYKKWMMAHDVMTSKHDIAERYPQGEVIARIVSDTEALRELVTSGTFGIFIDIFFVVSCLASFIDLNPFTGTTLAVSEIAAALLLLWGSRRMREVFHAVSKARGMVQRTIANLVGGFSETHYNQHKGYASKRGEIVFNDYLGKILKSNVWDAGYYSLAESLYPLLLCLMVFVFPYSGIREAALIFAIVDLIQRSIGPVKDIASKIANVQRASAGVSRLQEFLGDLDQVPSTPSVVDPKFDNQKISSIHVKIDEFVYPRKSEGDSDRFRVSDVDIKAQAGQVVGIVGLSGCGKSTVLKIMAAQIIPDKFKINLQFENNSQLSWDGATITNHALYQRQVGLVSQESHLFSDTVQFNISMDPNPRADFDEFWHWASSQIPYLKIWGLKPDDTLEPKVLSAGQRQLLAAIRACYLKKTVVLLDEISSALDSDLEEALRAVVKLIQSQCLTFVVAHRLETVISADKIIVMEDGRLLESGKHNELLNCSQVYREFVHELSLSPA
ncbi:MAG: hypothetical protein CME71_00190 [Halobacteriovorax sp.]|nr:hypothetical protein [Halobacteriovorax sp.]|tara:strand:+ start:2614 stop:4392 length:1779 start_codon:yes stop_codon:yes gene_type:complete